MLGYIIAILISLVVGAVGGYLVLRNNPKYKAYLDAEADKLARKTGSAP